MLPSRPIRVKIWMLLLLPILVALAMFAKREFDGWSRIRSYRLEAQRFAEWRDRYASLIQADRGPVPRETLVRHHEFCSVLANYWKHMADGGSMRDAPTFISAEPPEPPPIGVVSPSSNQNPVIPAGESNDKAVPF
jgi:hypothetical protein